MNTLVYTIGAILILIGFYFLVSRELKGQVIVPSHIPHIPSQKGGSRGGHMLHEIKNLHVPGWHWGDCCSGAMPSGAGKTS